VRGDRRPYGLRLAVTEVPVNPRRHVDRVGVYVCATGSGRLA
jgi:hypothetical protein